MTPLIRRRAMMHRVDDDEGMFAHWSGEDALVSNVWHDRVNNLAIRIDNTTTHGDGWYSITKTENKAPIGYMKMQSDVSPYIDYEFVVKVLCDIQAIDGYDSLLLSYGSIMQTKWSYAFSAGVSAQRTVLCAAKNSGNRLVTNDVDGVLTDWDIDGWNENVTIKTGIYLKPNDKQRVFTSVNGTVTETIDVNKVLLRPTYNTATASFALFGNGEAGAKYLNNYRFVLRIRDIKMYNIKK